MNKEKKISRYGKFPIFHPVYLLLVLFIVVIACDIEHKLFLSILALLVLVFFLYRALSPFFEKFSVQGNEIFHAKVNYHDVITVPNDAIFIFSHTTVEGIGILRDRFMVNIVVDTIDDAFSKLHEDKRQNEYEAFNRGCSNLAVYDNHYIKGHFKHRCIYSFVYNESFVNTFFNEQKKPVILPRSLADKIQIEPNGFEVIIDEER